MPRSELVVLRSHENYVHLFHNSACHILLIHSFPDQIWLSFLQQIDETWAKAYVLKGNALRLIKQFDDAIATYREMLKHHKNKEKVLDSKWHYCKSH